jgi:hypothetical protein
MKAAVESKPELGGRNFDCPEGIRFVEIDADYGGISTLSCPHRELIAVTERLAPTVECLLHGNLPDSDGIGADQAVEGDRNDEPILTQHSKSPALIFQPENPPSLTSTRVDVDVRGRRTLTNSMR